LAFLGDDGVEQGGLGLLGLGSTQAEDATGLVDALH
jgi:hypothetical protein